MAEQTLVTWPLDSETGTVQALQARKAASQTGRVGPRLLVALHLGCSRRAAVSTHTAARAQGSPSRRPPTAALMIIIIVYSGRGQPDPSQEPTGPSRTQSPGKWHMLLPTPQREAVKAQPAQTQAITWEETCRVGILGHSLCPAAAKPGPLPGSR